MRMPMDSIHRMEGCDQDATTGMHSMVKRPFVERNDATSVGKTPVVEIRLDNAIPFKVD